MLRVWQHRDVAAPFRRYVTLMPDRFAPIPHTAPYASGNL